MQRPPGSSCHVGYAPGVEDSGVLLNPLVWDTQRSGHADSTQTNPQWWSGWLPVTVFVPLLNFKCLLFFFLFFASTSSLSILLCSQDEVNQIMETNLWLRHVSLWCMTVQMESWARAWSMDPAFCHTWFFRAGLTSWIIHGGELFKHIDPSCPFMEKKLANALRFHGQFHNVF